MSEWVRINERLPKPHVNVLIFMVDKKMRPAIHEGFVNERGVWCFHCYLREPYTFTHWMPMPLPPDEVLEYLLKDGDDNAKENSKSKN